MSTGWKEGAERAHLCVGVRADIIIFRKTHAPTLSVISLVKRSEEEIANRAGHSLIHSSAQFVRLTASMHARVGIFCF